MFSLQMQDSFISGVSILFLEALHTTEDSPRAPRPSKTRNHLKLTFSEHLHPQPGILEEVKSPQFEPNDHAKFEHSPALLDVGESRSVKRRHLRNSGLHPSSEGYDFHSIHHLGDIDFLRTPRSTRLTRCAQPDRLAIENQVVHAQSDGMYQLGRLIVHGVRYRTTGRTLPTLIAEVYVLPTFAEDCFGQLRL